MKQRKSINLKMEGKVPKGSMFMERKITPQTMAKIVMIVAEDAEKEQQEKIFQRELKKQEQIIKMLN
jgi:predicted nuclease of predicted toxin-antitoxin system